MNEETWKEKYYQLQNRYESLEERYILLNEKYLLVCHRHWAKKSEILPPEQYGFFDEAESEKLKTNEVEEIAESDSSKEVGAKNRGKRAPLPAYLPREEIIHDIEDKQCPHDGSKLKKIGEEISERLKIIPAKIIVEKHIRPKYACSECYSIVTNNLEKRLIPKSNATASLLSYIATSKYVDAVPLYRQVEMFERSEMRFSTSTLARWMVIAGEKVEPLITLLREELLKSKYIHMDETPVQVLNEENKRAETKSYMWVQAIEHPYPIILFHYAKNRSGNNVEELLDDFKGAIHIDGYTGYDRAIKKNELMRLGCWAHARRKFFEASKTNAGSSLGKHALLVIKKLYKIESAIKGMNFDDRFKIRQNDSMKILSDFKMWLDETKGKITPKSSIGEAVSYALNEWEYLRNCFSSGEYEIDNNFIERHIRPFAIGRKNWMFSVSPEGAVASANLYSLVETAKANNLNPYEYLENVFTKLPSAESEKDFLNLLPIKVEN